ncbi:MAG: hypothetical protein ACKVU4_12630 [Phycisphaerales bacterium]
MIPIARLACAVLGASVGVLVAGSARAGPTGYTFSDARLNGNNHLIRIDLATGATTDLGPRGAFGLEGVAVGPGGRVFGVTAGGGFSSRLWDITDAPGTPFGPWANPQIFGAHVGLAYNPVNGFLYALGGTGGGVSTLVKTAHLYRHNPPNWTPVWVSSFATAVGWYADSLAINAQGEAYAADFSFDGVLYRVNLANGVRTLVGSLGLPEMPKLSGMDFDECGTLWALAGFGEIYRINTVTGAATRTGTLDIPGLFCAGLAVDAQSGCGCYADCNADGQLSVADFGCFQGKYVLGDLYADCTGDGNLTVADFGCFQGKYVVGCP